MALRVTGKNLDIGEALRERVLSRLSDVSGRTMDGRINGSVTVEKEAHGFRAFTSLQLPTGSTLQAEGFAPDAYAACDITIDRVDRRLKRYNRRLKDRSAAHHAAPAEEAATYVIEAPAEETHNSAGFEPVIIAESTTSLKRMTVAEAVIDLDVTGARALAFRHAGHGRVNIVYRRADGHVGWIDPPPSPA